MLIFLLVLILISNAVSTNKNKAILYSRLIILGLLSISVITYNSLYVKVLESGIGIYNGLFNISVVSQSFNIFILILSSMIGILTAFYYKKKYNTVELVNYTTQDSEKKSIFNNNENLENTNILTLNKGNTPNTINTLFLNKNGFQFTLLEYGLITVFILSGAIFLISVGDLVSLFLSIELQSYGLYILATMYRNSESATGSGLTYFLLGGLSSCFILLGSAMLYVNSGMTNLDNIYILNSISQLTNVNSNEINTLFTLGSGSLNNSNGLNYFNFSFIILTVGLLFKISAAPFHFWSPDVYDGIPTVVTTFVATIAKISLLILMLELVSYSDISTSNVYETVEISHSGPWALDNTSYFEWKNILILSSLMSLLVGSLLGLTQYRIKRLFAYSTISHVGFILLALCINKVESVQAYIFYILQYSVSNLNAFFILIAIGYTLSEYVYKPNMLLSTSKDKLIDVENSPIQLLSQIKGYFHINSFLAISFAITLFSFVGIPPLIGFFAKQMVLSAALDEGYVFMTLVAIITSVIGAAYYLNLVKLIFFSKSDYKSLNIKNNTALEGNSIILINDKLCTIISILTMSILLFVFMPDEWFRIVNILSLSINKY